MHGIGVDIVRVERLEVFSNDRKHPFLTKNFTEKELEYCFSFADPLTHLAGTFAAKEAVCKAFGGRYVIAEIEIVHSKSGVPSAMRKKKKLAVSVSIAHEKELAIAAALR
jgi:holo-[acyl-carrier protein] synthase